MMSVYRASAEGLECFTDNARKRLTDYQRLGRGKPAASDPLRGYSQRSDAGLALAPVTPHQDYSRPKSGEPLTLYSRVSLYALQRGPHAVHSSHTPPANHVRGSLPSVLMTHRTHSGLDRPPPKPLDALALRSRSTLNVRRPVEGSRPAPTPSNCY